ncbi:hypothetical protein GGR26_001901 [Lewinella marina]|uniref:hypothetical protein n=1 Tax=Neolewinella marina TaxID=438751 RepID=UPI00117A52E5|nr:hypothetical protein [Neolewinella marina]NJB86133.1 hypothetical protein [Neolewinella marina]
MISIISILSRIRLRWRRLRRPLPPSVVATAWADRAFQFLDLLFVFDLYEAVSNRLTPGLRRLSPRERILLQPIFGDSVPYDLIRIDERAQLGPRQYRFLYVSFHTINSWGPISEPTLVHEVVHVWQYVHHGALYIPRALAAQRTAAGYDYGGLPGLRAAESLLSFNYEQMADVIEDAYRLANGYPAQWLGGRTAEALPNYYRFMYDLRVRQLPQPYW